MKLQRNHIIIIITIVTIIILGLIYLYKKKKNPIPEITFRKWSMDPKISKQMKNANQNAVSNVMIPEYVMQNMIPDIILNKYYPDSLINNMPHKKERYINDQKLGEDIIGKRI